jgi:hypothetical protein
LTELLSFLDGHLVNYHGEELGGIAFYGQRYCAKIGKLLPLSQMEGYFNVRKKAGSYTLTKSISSLTKWGMGEAKNGVARARVKKKVKNLQSTQMTTLTPKYCS